MFIYIYIYTHTHKYIHSATAGQRDYGKRESHIINEEFTWLARD